MKKLLCIILLTFISIVSLGEIILESDDLSPTTSDTFQIRVIFNNEDEEKYTIDGLEENFDILSRGSSSNYSIINGKTNSQKAYTYLLFPKKVGTFKLQAKGKNNKSNEITIKIAQGKPATISNGGTETSVSIKDGQEFYFGEKIPYIEKLTTTKKELSTINAPTLPNFGDLSAKLIPTQSANGEFKARQIKTSNGAMAIEFTLLQYILEPTSSGEKTITSSNIETTEVYDSRRKPYPSKNLKITVLPLPAEKPTNFQNVVGKVNLDYRWNKDKINYGESVVLTLKLAGKVNLDYLDNIIGDRFSNEFNVFESIKSSKEDIQNEQYYGEKEFEIAFIPKNIGDVIIPEINIPYFNIETKKFEDIIIKSKKIIVEQGTSQISEPQSSINTNQVNSSGNTVAPSGQNNSIIVNKEIEINTIPESMIKRKIYNKYGNIFLILCVVQTLLIIYLIRGNVKIKRNKNSLFKNLKSAKDDKEFYEFYCEFMKEKFNYAPKVHLEDRLIKSGASESIVQLNNEIEECIYSSKPLNRTKILKTLKKEIN
ncbi:MAG: BatD family protein [Fusobacteriaceae bacterium]|jgi:hypothetical protein|nr:BatD family protein [Fusobacteriaceae bacterium]